MAYRSTNNIFLSPQTSQQYFQSWLISQTNPNEQGAQFTTCNCVCYLTDCTWTDIITNVFDQVNIYRESRIHNKELIILHCALPPVTSSSAYFRQSPIHHSEREIGTHQTRMPRTQCSNANIALKKTNASNPTSQITRKSFVFWWSLWVNWWSICYLAAHLGG